MIRFSLHCDGGHSFEIWFRSNDDYDHQQGAQLIACPVCGSTAVDKALMAPAIAPARLKHKTAVADKDRNAVTAVTDSKQADIFRELQEFSRRLRNSADYVGRDFAEEARKIHFGETTERAIYGNASAPEISSLLEDGVPVLPLPLLPEEQN